MDSEVDEMMRTLKEHALRYLEFGWSIIPLRLDDKRPAITWEEYQRRRATPDEVEKWFADGVPAGDGSLSKAFGLALVTGEVSGLVVVDCDSQDALAYAVNELDLFSFLGVKTTRGQHLYFKHPGRGERVANKVGGTGRDWPQVAGLDLRGDGGYVVIPPTVKFDKEGKFTHQYAWTVPTLDEVGEMLAGLPTWRGVSVRPALPVMDGEWSFDKLRLDTVRTYGGNAWAQAHQRTEQLGRQMGDGDGRNAMLTRYVGECVAGDMSEEQVAAAVEQFSSTFFSVPLPAAEVAGIIRSVVDTDRRNHPEKYDKREKYDSKNDDRKARAKALRLIRPSNLAELKRLAGGRRFLLDPLIPAQAIVQVAGFNGHGKSFKLMNLLWAAALGKGYGSVTVRAPVRTLYLDFEMAAATLTDRTDELEKMIGPMSEDMMLWSAAVSELDLSLTTEEGITNLQELINEAKPQIVVIDTVRSAWPGMEEASPHAWVKVNNLAVAVRNAGMSVVLVHHRNKPNQSGLGREAGSTAQLKDLDVQVFVTKVIEDQDQAKREAAIPDSNTTVVDFNGKGCSAFTYLRAFCSPGFVLRSVFELSFGKVRQSTENNVTTYIGIAENIKTGRKEVVHSPTPRQKAERLHTRNTPIEEISEKLQIPVPTIHRWTSEYTNHINAQRT